MRSLTVASLTMKDNLEEKSLAILKPFLLENSEKAKVRENVGKFYKDITFI